MVDFLLAWDAERGKVASLHPNFPFEADVRQDQSLMGDENQRKDCQTHGAYLFFGRTNHEGLALVVI